MIKGDEVTVYNWFDIQQEICKIMGIPENKFRDYHEIIGGDYCDLWHVALDTVIPGNMANGSIVTMFGIENVNEDIKYLMSTSGDRTRKFFEAYAQVFDELDPNFQGVLVRFDW